MCCPRNLPDSSPCARSVAPRPCPVPGTGVGGVGGRCSLCSQGPGSPARAPPATPLCHAPWRGVSPAFSFPPRQVYIRIKDDEWNVYRRYTEFRTLHHKLQSKYPQVRAYNFPPKKAIGNKVLSLGAGRLGPVPHEPTVRSVFSLWLCTRDAGLPGLGTRRWAPTVRPGFSQGRSQHRV